MSENLVLEENNGNVMVATFNITNPNTTIKLENLIGMTSIDWGDGIVETSLPTDGHTYTNVGEYTCKIYDVTTICSGAFDRCNSLISVIIPDSVMMIDEKTFWYCGNLESVTIGNSVTTIGPYAFQACCSLTSVVIGSSVTKIRGSAFMGCDSLTSIEIPDSVETIDGYAFSYCDNLTSVVIGDNVTSIGESAFEDCTSLTSVVIPDNVTSIGFFAFRGCSSLTSLTVNENNMTYQSVDGNLYSKDGKKLIQYAIGKIATSFTIPDSVTLIDSYAFSQCSNLTSVVIPDGVTSINNDAFYNCDSIINISIGDGVRHIGDDVFNNCDSLTSVSFKNPTPIAYNKSWFQNTSSVQNIYVPYDSVNSYIKAWPSVENLIKADPNDAGYKTVITLNNLKYYNKQVKENYLQPLETSFEDMQTTVNGLEENIKQHKVTWAQLKTLRDSCKLIPGHFYRITDYVCTTTQEDTRAMDHQFDIIVQALSESSLSENASADYHEGDTYFIKVAKGGISSSNIISEQVETELVDGDVEWLYNIFEDTSDLGCDYEGLKEVGHVGDSFVVFDFKENDNGIMVPVLYKNDVETYLDEGTDYQDTYFYVGEYELDGVIYDKWRKIEEDGVNWDSPAKIYALTNKIVGEGLLIEATFEYSNGEQEKIANLPAWELKYCLDNDTNRFAWADNGEGYAVESIYVESSSYSNNWWTKAGILEHNGFTYYQWENSDSLEDEYKILLLSTTENPTIGEDLGYVAYDNGTVDEVVSSGEGTVSDIRYSGGKGVIYYMKDEWNNECSYDFKNIQFKRYMITEVDQSKVSDLVGHYLGMKHGQMGITINEGDYIWCYTFSWLDESDSTHDASIIGQYLINDEGYYCGVYNNVIKLCSYYRGGNYDYISDTNGFSIMLNNIVFLSEYAWDSGIFYGYYSNIFGNDCYGDTFNDRCSDNIFGDSCFDNIFGKEIMKNTFGRDCCRNVFGNTCCNNTFGDSCCNNTFGNSCSDNTFINECAHNIFGHACYDNIFGSKCGNNTFGDTFAYNTFGNNCCNNTFGNNYYFNTFGNDCRFNTFVDELDRTHVIDYVYSINFANGCSYIRFFNDEQGDSNYRIQNITVLSGVCGTTYEQYRELYVPRDGDPIVFEANNTKHIILDAMEEE